ncbi:MAG: terminase small subunit, partial [Planctomycetota bacterium]|nr:terminase small subunit [Planctomycetota bacterium]
MAAYAGNAAEAALAAGYGEKNARRAASRLLKSPEIVAAIQARRRRERSSPVASREDRQAFWIRIVEDETFKIRERLRASELLAKSNGDFLSKPKHDLFAGMPAMFELATRGMAAEAKAKEAAEAKERDQRLEAGLAASGLAEAAGTSLSLEKSGEIMKAAAATKTERQAFWTRIVEDETFKIRERLRASELLAKSEGDFLPKPKNDPSFGMPAMFEWATREMTAEAKAKEDAE